METNTQNKIIKKQLVGTVVSAKMDKTIVVSVVRFVQHPKYKKFFKSSKKYKAHDQNNEYKEGDTVTIEPCRPISKDKRFVVVSGKSNNNSLDKE